MLVQPGCVCEGGGVGGWRATRGIAVCTQAPSLKGQGTRAAALGASPLHLVLMLCRSYSDSGCAAGALARCDARRCLQAESSGTGRRRPVTTAGAARLRSHAKSCMRPMGVLSSLCHTTKHITIPFQMRFPFRLAFAARGALVCRAAAPPRAPLPSIVTVWLYHAL